MRDCAAVKRIPAVILSTMITADPGALAATIHNRMPALLSPRDIESDLTESDPKHLIRSTNTLDLFPC